MGRITTRKPITQLKSENRKRRQDTLAVEEPLEIRIGGEPYVVTMRTPGHDVELATGFLVTEGVVTVKENISYARHRQSYNVLEIGLTVPAPSPRRFTTTSACWVCGKDSIHHLHTTPHYPIGEINIDQHVLAGLPDKLREGQTTFDKTGGTHAAGLFTPNGELIVLREDIGRHNAVDKVIGWAVLNDRMPLDTTVLQVSGRASFELVNKATMAAIPIFGAVSAPSSMAVDMAEEAGMTLAGFMRGEKMNLYTNPERVNYQRTT